MVVLHTGNALSDRQALGRTMQSTGTTVVRLAIASLDACVSVGITKLSAIRTPAIVIGKTLDTGIGCARRIAQQAPIAIRIGRAFVDVNTRGRRSRLCTVTIGRRRGFRSPLLPFRGDFRLVFEQSGRPGLDSNLEADRGRFANPQVTTSRVRCAIAQPNRHQMLGRIILRHISIDRRRSCNTIHGDRGSVKLHAVGQRIVEHRIHRNVITGVFHRDGIRQDIAHHDRATVVVSHGFPMW